MSRSMAEVLKAHQLFAEWEECLCGLDVPFDEQSGEADLAFLAAHQAEMLEAEGFGYVCPFDCDRCHSDECPCDRLGCAGSVAPGG